MTQIVLKFHSKNSVAGLNFYMEKKKYICDWDYNKFSKWPAGSFEDHESAV